MTHQPDDTRHFTLDPNQLRGLDEALILRAKSQAPDNKCDDNLDLGLPSYRNDLIPSNNNEPPIINDNFDFQTQTSNAPYHEDDELFPGWRLGFVDSDEVPVNEITVTTAPSDTESHTDLMPEAVSLQFDFDDLPDLTPDEVEDVLRQHQASISLEAIDKSIQHRAMSFEVQPPAEIRLRYKSEGKRQMEKSRTKPMIINLPNLQDVKLDPDQSFSLRLMLTTYSDDPSAQAFLHVNKMEYHSDDAEELNDGTVCVLVDQAETQAGQKVLPRSSFIKRKLEKYSRRLTPLNFLGSDKNNVDEEENVSVSEAKDIYKKLNLKASRIICQLLIKQNDFYRYTDIRCETHTMEEKKQTPAKKKRSARAMESDDDEMVDERPSTSKSKSKSTKRKKHSH